MTPDRSDEAGRSRRGARPVQRHAARRPGPRAWRRRRGLQRQAPRERLRTAARPTTTRTTPADVTPGVPRARARGDRRATAVKHAIDAQLTAQSITSNDEMMDARRATSSAATTPGPSAASTSIASQAKLPEQVARQIPRSSGSRPLATSTAACPARFAPKRATTRRPTTFATSFTGFLALGAMQARTTRSAAALVEVAPAVRHRQDRFAVVHGAGRDPADDSEGGSRQQHQLRNRTSTRGSSERRQEPPAFCFTARSARPPPASCAAPLPRVRFLASVARSGLLLRHADGRLRPPPARRDRRQADVSSAAARSRRRSSISASIRPPCPAPRASSGARSTRWPTPRPCSRRSTTSRATGPTIPTAACTSASTPTCRCPTGTCTGVGLLLQRPARPGAADRVRRLPRARQGALT